MITDTKLPRREFLRLSLVAAAGAAASGAVPLSLLGAASGSAVDPVLSVGYGSGAPENDQAVRLGDAGGLLSGDVEFLRRSVLVTIGGFARGSKQRGVPTGHEVDAIFPAHGYTPEKYPRFRAWLTVNETDDAISTVARFVLPVSSDGGAQFVVRRLASQAQKSAAPVWQESLLRLGLGVDSGVLKLQRGIYVVAFRDTAGDNVPNWSSYRLVRQGGALTIPSAPFSYVLLTVDYAE